MPRLNVCCLALVLLVAAAGPAMSQAAPAAGEDASEAEVSVPKDRDPGRTEASSEPAAQPAGRPTSLPKFVSLRSGKVNLRSGPGVQYPIDWVYQRRDLPVQLVDEFGTWRRVRDWQGTIGWVHQSMIHGKRTVMVTVPETVLRRAPDSAAAGLARLGEKVIAALKACKTGWCQVEVEGLSGWLANDAIFGLNAGERRN